jgi:hypothetical protein
MVVIYQLALLLLGFVSVSAWASPARCDSLPYGDDPRAYSVAAPGFKNIAKLLAGATAQPLEEIMQTQVPSALRQACKAKFENDPGATADLNALDITDQDIATGPTMALALRYLGTKATLADLKHRARPISVEDFVLDGKDLVAKHVDVSISGAYALEGQTANLYASTQAVIMAHYHRDSGTQPSVPLMTENAMHYLRRKLLTCQSNPGSAQIGCPVTVRGKAITCTETNAFGVKREMPCVNVEDGE